MIIHFTSASVLALLIFLFIWFKIRNNDPYAQQQTLLIISPAMICIVLAGTLGVGWVMSVGIIISVILSYWISVLRFPLSYREAWKHFKSHQMNAALQSLNDAIQENSRLWQAYQLRALVNSSLGFFTNAERDARQAIGIKPQCSINYQTLGLVFWQQAEFERARYAYLDAYRILPQSPLYQFSLGVASYKLKSYEDSKRYLSLAAKAKNLPQLISPQNCLLLFYYLAKSYDILNQIDGTKKSLQKMKEYQTSLDALKEQVKNDQPQLKKSIEGDISEIEQLLSSA